MTDAPEYLKRAAESIDRAEKAEKRKRGGWGKPGDENYRPAKGAGAGDKSGVPAGGYVPCPPGGYVPCPPGGYEEKPTRGMGVAPPRPTPESIAGTADRKAQSELAKDALFVIGMDDAQMGATRVTALARFVETIEGKPLQKQQIEHSGAIDTTPEDAEDRIAEIMARAAQRAALTGIVQ